MRYGIFRSRGVLPPWEQDIDIYIAPVAEKADRCQALTPLALRKGGEFTLMHQSFHIRTYEGCPGSAVEAVQDALASEFRGRAEKFSSRMRLFFSAGIAAAVLGLVNIFIPDPLPFLDEMVLIIGGGLVSSLGGSALKRQVGPYRNCIKNIIENIEGADIVPDPVLSTVYRAIRCRARPGEDDSGKDCADDIERESLWLVEHLNISALIRSEAVDRKRFISVMRILARSFRARLFLSPLLRKTRRYRRLLDKLGMDVHAAAVYEELFARAGDIFAEGGEKFP